LDDERIFRIPGQNRELAISISLSIFFVTETEITFDELCIRTVALEAVLTQDRADVFVEVDLLGSFSRLLGGRKDYSCGKQDQ
jgi:hypothetical protein